MTRAGAAASALAAAAAILLAAQCAGRSVERDPMPDRSSKDAVLLEVPDDPTISMKVSFDVGSEDDPPGKEGLALVTGTLLAEGSTTENRYEAILEKLYPLAATYGVRVDREMTVLSGRTHEDNLEAYWALYSDAWLRPAFAADDFERIKADVLNAIEKSLRYQSDEELGKAALNWFVFQGTRYAHPELGTVAGVRSITLDDVRDFYRRYYTRDNAKIALGGGFDRALAERFRASLAGLPEGDPPGVPAPQPAAIDGRQVLLVSKEGADASVSLGFPIAVRRGDRDFYPLAVANSWLGEHRNSASHLFQVIREQRGLNYGDYSYIEAFPEGGRRQFPPPHVGRRQQLFEIWIRTLPNDQAVFALRAALRELDRLVDQGMTRETFELTRSFLSKYALHFADTTLDRLGYAVDDRFYGIDEPGHLERFTRAMETVTLEQVNAAIRRHLQVDDLKIAIVTGAADELRAKLVSGEPTPVEYAAPKSAEILAEDREIAAYPLRIAAETVRVVPVDEMFER